MYAKVEKNRMFSNLNIFENTKTKGHKQGLPDSTKDRTYNLPQFRLVRLSLHYQGGNIHSSMENDK